MVRAKFTCVSKREYRGWSTVVPVERLYDYEFSPVTNSKTEENALFWKYTPSGKLNLSSIVDDQFEIGADYYLEFTKATA